MALRRVWLPLALAATTTALGWGIARAAPGGRYNAAQVARAEKFAQLVASHGDGLLRANLLDIGFAASYGALGVVLLRRLRGAAARVGLPLVVLAALADEVENILLRSAIEQQRSGRTPGSRLDAVHAAGYVKWGGLVGAVVALVVAVVATVRRR